MCGQACCTPRRAFKKDATNQQDQSCSVGKLLHATALVVLVSRTDWRREVREAAARLPVEIAERSELEAEIAGATAQLSALLELEKTPYPR